MYGRPKNDIEYSRRRLDEILSRRRLRFNPYTVSDQKLMEIVGSTGWGSLLDITEYVTVRFTRLNEVSDIRKFNGIFMTVAESDDEIFIPLRALIYPITAADTLRPERTWVGKRPIYTAEDVRRLVGKTYFVSHLIRGASTFRRGKCAYHLYRVKGVVAIDAKVIREAIIGAKIAMLERLLENVRSEVWLDCDKDLFDYEPRVRHAIDLIRRFHDHPIPES